MGSSGLKGDFYNECYVVVNKISKTAEKKLIIKQFFSVTKNPKTFFPH